MTYFGFLFVFLVLPIMVLSLVEVRTKKMGKAVWMAIGIQIALALSYTTPWDNHLVATGVWYYDPRRVTGILLGYVPLEEYVFFVLETLLVGLWWRWWSGRGLVDGGLRWSGKIRLWAAVAAAILWLGSAIVLISGWQPGTYLSITLVWALPPIIIQLLFGADILWHERRLAAAVILSMWVYLSAADALAIRSGIWAIDPAQSTGVFIGSLPLEEAAFFFVTVTLITFGLTLTLSKESQRRFLSREWGFARKAKAAQSAKKAAPQI